MKKMIFIFLTAFVFCAFTPFYVCANDMRASVIKARKKKEIMLQKAALEKKKALEEAAKTRQQIFSHRISLEAAILKLKNENQKLADENIRMENELSALKIREEELDSRLRDMEGDIKELTGFVRANARDLDTLLNQGIESAFTKKRNLKLKPIFEETKFPGMDDIRAMTNLFFEEIEKSGEVRIQKGIFVDRAGKEVTGNILVLGNFTAAYRKGGETGFLIYSDKSRRLFALSKLPGRKIAEKINDYMDGKSISVPMDISKGAALRQLTHRLSLYEQIPKGGPIVWPILGIGFIAVLIIIERGFYLFFKSINADRFFSYISAYARKNEWDKCENLCEHKIKKPLARVLLAGLKARDLSRPDIENVLQESILNEIPRLEKFLSSLGMLAAIAPLLGLLGTVTGMINTFHVITYFGAGDPRMMSGGISEALITTMLGLSVAIPVMLCHTLLTRKVETMIARMEEKSVTLVNIIFTSPHDLQGNG